MTCEICLQDHPEIHECEETDDPDEVEGRLMRVTQQSNRYLAALKKIDIELTIPAAEYVPAIPAVWEIIKKAIHFEVKP